MKSFNVIKYDLNRKKFESYDIMPYLLETWKEFKDKYWEMQATDPEFMENPSQYWKLPVTFEEYKQWVDNQLQYQYWARFQYELILSPWPCKENEDGEMILDPNIAEKWDVYKQCQMNLDIITQIFSENIDDLV